MKIAVVAGGSAIRSMVARACGPQDEVVALARTNGLSAARVDLDCRVLVWDETGADTIGDGTLPASPVRGIDEPSLFLLVVVPAGDPEATRRAFALGADAVAGADSADLEPCLEVARRMVRREDDLRGRFAQLEQIRHDLESRNATLSEIASRDPLTGLRNRRYLCDALDEQFARTACLAEPLSLAMIDVDRFKAFNDQFGHLAGDDVLRSVSTILRSSVREHDVVARYGGEEFAILLPNTVGDDSRTLVERLRRAIADHPWPLRPITISLGVATRLPDASRPTDLIDQADRSLYLSKALGRNRATHAADHPTRAALGLTPDPVATAGLACAPGSGSTV